MKQLETSLERIAEAILRHIPSIVLGIVVLVIGTYLVRLILKIVKNRFAKNDVDLSLRDFILSILKFVLYAMVALSCASTMGFQTTSFLAVLSAASLAIGLSLQGSLSNFAGGVLILLFKPFRVGDSIAGSGGASGTVERIDILYTTLRTGDGIAVFAPNGPLANAVITNYSALKIRRIEYTIAIAPEADIASARKVIREVFEADPRILRTPSPEILVNQLTPTAINLLIHAWSSKENYTPAFSDNLEHIRDSFLKNDIPFPPSQTEVHIHTPGTTSGE